MPQTSTLQLLTANQKMIKRTQRIISLRPVQWQGLSPRNLDDVRVDEFALDRPALETHAAQLAANEAAEGSAASASEGSASTAAIAAALQRRANLKINQKPTSVPPTPMTTVLEEAVPPSDPGSY
eukprot:734499-Amphidinium_carterae.1